MSCALSENTVIPAQAGIQTNRTARVADKIGVLLRKDFCLDWIPACAGMTMCGDLK
jgi:hypothetical protein